MGEPASAALTWTVSVQGLDAEGDTGQLTLPVSELPPVPGSG